MVTKSWIIKIIKDENGDLILPLPTDLIEEIKWEIGDEIEFKKINHEKFEITNQSMLLLKRSQLRRRFNAVFKKLSADNHPLKRVLVKSSKEEIILILSHINKNQ